MDHRLSPWATSWVIVARSLVGATESVSAVAAASAATAATAPPARVVLAVVASPEPGAGAACAVPAQVPTVGMVMKSRAAVPTM